MSAMIALISSTSPRSASGGRPRALEGICFARSAMFDRATPKVSHTAVTAKYFGNDSERNRCFFGRVAISSASLRISPSPNRTDPPCARRARYRTPSAVIVDERGAPGPDALHQPADPPESDRFACLRCFYSAALPVARLERLICSSITTRRFCMRWNRSAT